MEQQRHNSRSAKITYWPLFILLVGAILVFWRIGYPSFNIDEIFSIFASEKSWSSLFALLQRDSHPPMWYVILKPWTALGRSETFTRCLPALCHIGCIILVLSWGRELFVDSTPDRRQKSTVGTPPLPGSQLSVAVLASLLTIFSSWAIYRAQELRQYAPLALAIWVALYCFYHQRYLSYTLITAFSLLLHYNALLLLPVPWLYLGWQHLTVPSEKSEAQPNNAWRLLLYSQAAALAVFALWIPSFIAQYQHGQGTSTLLTESIYAHSFLSYVWEVFAYLGMGAQNGFSATVNCLVALAVILMAVLGAFLLRPQPAAKLILLGVAVPVVLAVVAYYLTGRGLISGKHMHFVYPGLYLLLGSTLTSIFSQRRWLSIILLALFIGPNSRCWYTLNYVEAYQNPPWRTVANDINKLKSENDAVLVITGYQSLALSHYNTGDLAIYPLPNNFQAPGEIDKIIAGLEYHHNNIWLVEVSAELEDPQKLVKRSFESHWKKLHSQSYYNVAPFDCIYVDLFSTNHKLFKAVNSSGTLGVLSSKTGQPNRQ